MNDLQSIIAKLGRGQSLTDAEMEQIGMSTTTPTNPNTGFQDPLKNPAVKPTAREGYDYIWDAGLGSWVEQAIAVNTVTDPLKDPSSKPVPRAGYDYNWDANLGSWVEKQLPPDSTNQPATNVDVLKAILTGRGFNSSLIGSSTTFLQQLLSDGVDYDNAVELFLSAKDYTLKNGQKISSPFYEQYGYLNESLTKPRTASELYGFVEGVKDVVGRFNLNPKFASTDSLKKYMQNNVSVDDLTMRANTARLRALESDSAYIESMKRLGFINNPTDLTDFFLDPSIGEETLKQNQRMGVFAAEAVRRANSGIQFNKDLASQMAAGLTAKGYSEAQISAMAAEGYQNIAENLQPMTKLSGIYDKGTAITSAQVQSELEQEQFMGMASQKRKKLQELETRAFQGSSGAYTRYGIPISLSGSSAAGAF